MRLQLHWQILIALLLAVIAGTLTSQDSSLLGINLYAAYDFVGTLFINALKMIIVPLVVSSIIVGIAGIGGSHGLARMGGKTILYYMTTSLFAILIGLFFVNLFSPGIIDGVPAKDVLGLDASLAEEASSKVGDRGIGEVATVFLSMVPPNIIAAAADGQMLGLIFFAILFGFFITQVEEVYAESQYNFWQGAYQTMMKITDWVMKFAPIGVFALVAKVVTSTDNLASMFESLGLFALSVLLALATHVFIVMPLLLKYVARVNPLRHYRAMSPAVLTAFSTASSAATLPITIDCVEKNAGVSNRTSSFVLPLGATVNMDGTALYECVAAMFIAQAYGIELSLATQFTIVTIALLTSIGVAAVPAASLVAITIILSALGLPVEALGLILAVDRILDMFRTSVNVFSDSCGAVIIGRLEGEENILQENKS
ncbi:MAG: dicarboxylate/amino acid:cation symporter [Thioalkalispiraceae bacterium]|jgi:Na+/H+-dicarboxylate symporter